MNRSSLYGTFKNVTGGFPQPGQKSNPLVHLLATDFDSISTRFRPGPRPLSSSFGPQVFRQNKRATDVHDMIGLRIIVEPRSDGIYGARHSATSEYMDSAAGGNAQNSPEVGINASCGVPLATVAEAAPVEDSVCADIEVARRGSYERGLYNESPGSGRGRSGGGYKDARGRNGVGVASERGEGTGSVDIVGVAEGSDDVRSSEEGERREESKSKGKYRARSEKAELSAFTFKSFPPPYRDADSRLLHDVFEVLVGLFEEVPGRYKVIFFFTSFSR